MKYMPVDVFAQFENKINSTATYVANILVVIIDACLNRCLRICRDYFNNKNSM